jgi:hypothetical protein
LNLPTHKQITNAIFISVIIIASFASLIHVRGFWLITNNEFWATCLAVSTGLGIIGSMMATKYSAWTYVTFFIIIIIELIGNIYDAFTKVVVSSQSFQTFKQLSQPLFEMIYIKEELTDIVYMRWIATIEGAFIPLLVAVMFHIWSKHVYEAKEIKVEPTESETLKNETEVPKKRTRKSKEKAEEPLDITTPIDEIESIDNTNPTIVETVEQPVIETTIVVEPDIVESIVVEESTAVEEPTIVEESTVVESVETQEVEPIIIEETVEVEDEKKKLTT